MLQVVLCSGMEVFILVPGSTSPSCCVIEKDNPTPIACLAFEQATQGRAVIPPHQPHFIVEDNITLITCPALVQVTERVNPTPTHGTALSQVTSGPKPTTPVISSSQGGRGSQKYNDGHSLHKPPTFANIDSNTEACTSTLQKPICPSPTCVNRACLTVPREDAFSCISKGYTSLSNAPNCAPPACVNTSHSPGPREDAFSSTSKGYLSTSLSNTHKGPLAAVSRSFSNTLTHLRPPYHLSDHI